MPAINEIDAFIRVSRGPAHSIVIKGEHYAHFGFCDKLVSFGHEMTSYTMRVRIIKTYKIIIILTKFKLGSQKFKRKIMYITEFALNLA